MSRAKTTTLRSISAATGLFLTLGAPSPARSEDLRYGIETVAVRSAVQQQRSLSRPFAQRPRAVSSPWLKSPRHSSAATKASIIALATLGGMFGGAIAGGAIENWITPCRCDDPGLRGALIGAPVGAVAGGLLGFHFTR